MKIEMNFCRQYQTFEGFGASGAWWAQEVGGWTHPDGQTGKAMRDRIAQLLFDKTDGIGLRTYRYNLGAGSMESGKGYFPRKTRRARCFETAPGKYDFSKDENAVYIMKKCVEYGADEVVLFVNSPIERLTRNKMAHTSRRLIRENLSPKNYRSFAKYVLDVTEHFVKEGLPIKYISPINEPYWIWVGKQEGCHYSPRSAGRVMKVFGEELEKRPALSEVKLSGVENGDVRWFNKSYTRNLLKHDEAKNRIDSVDLHSYFLRPPRLPLMKRTDFLRRYRKWMDKNYPLTEIKMSEWCHMQRGRDKGIDSALKMAKIIFEDISILNVVSWQHWVAVSEVNYCDGLLYINMSDKTLKMTKRYYATGNFSKYIPYGAIRFDAKVEDETLDILGFRKDNRIILTITNNDKNKKHLTLPEWVKEARLIVTSESDNLAEYRIDGCDFTVSPESINTVIFEKKEN